MLLTNFHHHYSYLRAEAFEKLGKIIYQKARGGYAKVPAQKNFCDCGVYLLHYVETFVKNPDLYVDLGIVSIIFETKIRLK